MTIKTMLNDLPCRIRGVTYRKCVDGEDMFFVLINSRLSADMQKEAYLHEVEHIKQGDFDRMLSADKIELCRQGKKPSKE